ncbi:MAG TPA: ASKHA domain-containing protein [Desulfitobacteriaceae bacterium]|nr:ASKHA domain-containing protein [Desulfitobacteriaceae bacterium]
MPQSIVKFLPDNLTITVENGTSLLQAASLAGINLVSGCGGNGTCGACKVVVSAGQPGIASKGSLSSEQIAQGIRLSCQTLVTENLTVEIPPESRLQEHQILTVDSVMNKIKFGTKTFPSGNREDKNLIRERETGLFQKYGQHPLATKVRLQLAGPTLTDNAGDWTRLSMELKKVLQSGDKPINIPLSVLKKLPESLRDANWDISVILADLDSGYTVTKVEAGNNRPAYGLAIDIGTTTVIVCLLDLSNGNILDKQGTFNKQAKYGDDVISRIVYAVESPENLQKMQQLIIDTVNDLIDKILTRQKLDAAELATAVVAGNTTMTQLFLGIDPRYIRLEPYIPALNNIPSVAAREIILPEGRKIGLHLQPEGLVHIFPAVASYVGGDIVAGTLVTDMANDEEIVLFIDIGTNGEIVLGNKDWLVSCASSAGPCFEGGGISFGMRAMPGAIERIKIDPATLEVTWKVIGNISPLGISGSGLVDCLAELLNAGIIDRAGNFQLDHPVVSERLKAIPDEKIFVLAWAQQAGGKDILITENDVKNIIRAKGAIFAGIRSLLRAVDMEIDMISRIVIAGGFGNYLNINDSVKIGLLPDLPPEKYQYIGNSSLKGACLALLSQNAWQEAQELSRRMTYIELSVGPAFMDEFVSALFLPHTDFSLFPSATT